MASSGDDAGRNGPLRSRAIGSSDNLVGINPTAVADWIEQLGITFTAPLSFERIGLGQSNLTYLVRDAEGRKWVLRRPPLGELLASAHDVAREARILSALEDTPVPTPRVYGLTRDARGDRQRGEAGRSGSPQQPRGDRQRGDAGRSGSPQSPVAIASAAMPGAAGRHRSPMTSHCC